MIKLGKFFFPDYKDRYQYGGQQGHVFLLQWISTTILRAKKADQAIVYLIVTIVSFRCAGMIITYAIEVTMRPIG